jgi:hypothetical protein
MIFLIISLLAQGALFSLYFTLLLTNIQIYSKNKRSFVRYKLREQGGRRENQTKQYGLCHPGDDLIYIGVYYSYALGKSL